MNEELDALAKDHTWDLIIYLLTSLWLVISWFSRSILHPVGLLRDTMLVWMPKVSHQSMALTIINFCSGCLSLILLHTIGCCSLSIVAPLQE